MVRPIGRNGGFLDNFRMKADSRPVASSSAERGQQLLSRFLDVDELLVRPTADAQDPFKSVSEDSLPGKRISLERHQQLEQDILHAPAHPAPYLELAEFYKAQGRWKDVRRVLHQGIVHNPGNEDLVFFLEEISIQCANEEWVRAKREANRYPSEENRANLDRAEMDLSNARIAVCEARFGRHPDQIDLLIPWAIALRQLGRMEDSVRCLRRAQEHPELRSRASLQLGMAYQQQGFVLEALAAYRCAALFRAPPPSPELRQRALELAADLAEESNLIDSAIRYCELLAENASSESTWHERIAKLKLMQQS